MMLKVNKNEYLTVLPSKIGLISLNCFFNALCGRTGRGQETREIQKKLKVHLFVSVDGWEEACDQVLVESLVLAHLVDGVPLLRRHPLLDRLRRVFHLRIVAIHLLVRGHSCASLKKIQRSLGLRYKELLRIIDQSFHVGILLCEMSVLMEYSPSF